MFEVGKKYNKINDINKIYECILVEGNQAILKDPQGKWYAKTDWDYQYYTLFLPEPKRWSEWVNVYPDWNYAALFNHDSLEKAQDNAAPSRVGIIRFDWEQEEGKEKRLVKTELLGVSD